MPGEEKQYDLPTKEDERHAFSASGILTSNPFHFSKKK
jgi:hypothetical protein